MDSIIRLSPRLDLHVNESRWRYGKEGYGYDERSDDVDDLSRNKHCNYYVGDALARHIKRAPYWFDAERKDMGMRGELTILAIWIVIYIAIMLLAMLFTAVGLHMSP